MGFACVLRTLANLVGLGRFAQGLRPFAHLWLLAGGALAKQRLSRSCAAGGPLFLFLAVALQEQALDGYGQKQKRIACAMRTS